MSNEDGEAIIKIIEKLKVWDDGIEDRLKSRRIIAETLLRIPESVREKVLEDAIFIIMSGAFGASLLGVVSDDKREDQLFKTSNGRVWVKIEVQLILLNFGLMEKEGVEEEEMSSIVAHEIAHFTLEHNKISIASKEEEADNLIVNWGFKRAYHNYERFNRS